jgi:hypothetical protein
MDGEDFGIGLPTIISGTTADTNTDDLDTFVIYQGTNAVIITGATKFIGFELKGEFEAGKTLEFYTYGPTVGAYTLIASIVGTGALQTIDVVINKSLATYHDDSYNVDISKLEIYPGGGAPDLIKIYYMSFYDKSNDYALESYVDTEVQAVEALIPAGLDPTIPYGAVLTSNSDSTAITGSTRLYVENDTLYFGNSSEGTNFGLVGNAAAHGKFSWGYGSVAADGGFAVGLNANASNYCTAIGVGARTIGGQGHLTLGTNAKTGSATYCENSITIGFGDDGVADYNAGVDASYAIGVQNFKVETSASNVKVFGGKNFQIQNSTGTTWINPQGIYSGYTAGDTIIDGDAHFVSDPILTDTVTGSKYRIQVISGTLTATLIT